MSMRTKSAYLALSLLCAASLAACGHNAAKTQAAAPAKPDHVWSHAGKVSVLGDEWDWVCIATGRVDDAQVMRDDRSVAEGGVGANGPYTLYLHGGGYGDYRTLQGAKRNGERLFKMLGWTCP